MFESVTGKKMENIECVKAVMLPFCNQVKLFFYFSIALFCTLLSGMRMAKKIPFTNGEKKNSTVDVIYLKYYNVWKR
jgi:hypothetical protein